MIKVSHYFDSNQQNWNMFFLLNFCILFISKIENIIRFIMDKIVELYIMWKYEIHYKSLQYKHWLSICVVYFFYKDIEEARRVFYRENATAYYRSSKRKKHIYSIPRDHFKYLSIITLIKFCLSFLCNDFSLLQ